MDAGFLDNTAVADSDQTDPVDDSESEPIVQGPLLEIDKRIVAVDDGSEGTGDGDGTLNTVGDVIEYEIDVRTGITQPRDRGRVRQHLVNGVMVACAIVAAQNNREIRTSFARKQLRYSQRPQPAKTDRRVQ